MLLDITPDEEMQNEGIAREVINRIQKLRKKAHLVPSDPIKVYYNITPSNHSLASVAKQYKDFIETTTKFPVIEITDDNNSLPDKIIIQEVQQVLTIFLFLYLYLKH